MPKDQLVFRVVSPEESGNGEPVLATTEPDIFTHAGQESDLRVQMPESIGGVLLQRGMELSGVGHIFVGSGAEVRPDPDSLRIVGSAPTSSESAGSWD
jgi:hypothetical protein